MRHHRGHRKLGRVRRQRAALLSSLARSLVLHEGITTTVARAKELRPYVERLITAGKENTRASRRRAMRLLRDETAVKKLHESLRERFEKRAGGYTRIVRLGTVGKRAGESARIEFVRSEVRNK